MTMTLVNLPRWVLNVDLLYAVVCMLCCNLLPLIQFHCTVLSVHITIHVMLYVMMNVTLVS